MLKSIDYSVSFPTTGRCFQNRIEFAPGLTAITGRNEAGKTLNLEMIGYCLFGKAALRGLASDYKNLTATLHLEVKGQDVLIERAKKETMTVDGEVVAVGADAINRAVPALLGFGMDVFNIACAAQQGDLDALTKMRPTERRAMIDRLIGIDVLEAIEKECRQEAKAAETVATSLILSVSEPQEPVRPDNYEESALIQVLLDDVKEHEFLRSTLSQIREPVEPVAPEHVEGDVAELEKSEADRQAALQLQARLEGQLAGIPEPTVSREDLTKAVAYEAYKDEVRRRGPKPEWAEADLQIVESVWNAKRQIDRGTTTCPSCSHEFVDGEDIDVEQIRAYPDPILPLNQVAVQRQRLALWAEDLAEVEAFELPNIQQEILAHARTGDRTNILDQLGSVRVPVDRSGELRAARGYQQELAVFGERRARYDQDLATFRDAQARLDGMPDRSGELVELHERLASARAFEGQLDSYGRDLAHFQRIRADADAHRGRSEGFLNGSVALKRARVRVKQELAPDLSRAASTLLTAMTNGERRNIDVNEDFDILVDGQPLQTLSGSGKSVVNLALRIGLGQVLTARVLPIFLGDEIDKDMDLERAAATHGTLHSLRQFMKQVIIVTHKSEIEADNLVMMSA